MAMPWRRWRRMASRPSPVGLQGGTDGFGIGSKSLQEARWLPMKSTIKQIECLVARIEAGDPPKPKKSEEVYYDPAMSGFGIRLLKSGRASWFVEYRRAGKGLKKKTLGDVRVKNREAAIEEARALLGKIDYHKWDPEAARRERMRMDKVTFISVVPDFLDWKRKPRWVKGRLRKIRPKTLRAYELYLTKHFRPLHKLPLDEITREQLSNQLDRIEEEAAAVANARGGNETAYQCRSLINDFFNWAIGDGCKLPENHGNPASRLRRVPKNPPRARVLSDDEIRRIWKTCEDWEAETLAFAQKGQRRAPGGFKLLTDYPRAVQLLFLTGLREQEIGDLHWSEVDLPNGEIRIEEHRTKNGRVLCNPLPHMAIKILDKIKAEADAARPGDECVFGRGDGKDHPSKKPPRPAFKILDNGVKWKLGLHLGDTRDKINKRIRRGDVGFWKQVIDPAVERKVRYLLAARIPKCQIRDNEHLGFNTIKAIEAKMKAGPIPDAPAPIPHWTLHDIRRTYRTGLSGCGVDVNTGEALVGHRHRFEYVSDSNIGTYDLHEYWREKLHAVKEWQKRLRKILDGTAREIPRSKFGRKLAQLETTS
jgi:integrase